MGIQTTLDELRATDRIVDAIRLADDLALESSRDRGVRALRILLSAVDGDDQVAAIAATHALATMFDDEASRALSRLLWSERGFLREHAAWALGTGLPRLDSVGRLIQLSMPADFTGMIAQRTLEQWSRAIPEHLALALEAALLSQSDAPARARLVETLGLVRSPLALPVLLRISGNPDEPETVRTAAIAALGQRHGNADASRALAELAGVRGPLAEIARLALVDVEPQVEMTDDVIRARSDHRDGLTVAQLFLHADIDAELSTAGAGDTGGIATLLVRLGDALVTEPDIERVITVSRGPIAESIADLNTIAETSDGHVYGRVPLLAKATPSAGAWPLRVSARRGIRRILRAAGGVDLLHLRMADVGSLAAADVARELGIPVVFTLAPDPHSVIQSLELSGRLGRSDFGDVDLREHYWFRAKLVHQLASNAAHTVLFPRPELRRDMRELVGIDIEARPERHSIVPEGVDMVVVDEAVREAEAHAAGSAPSAALTELEGMIASLAPERRGLPLIVSVGRLHPIKGMASLVEAWSTTALSERANLMLIGGDLNAPSADERDQLALIQRLVPSDERAARGLMLPGHRRNDVVARWVAAARTGLPGYAAPNGVYVCASLKEEFGIALLEAMGAGLMVVAPNGGGPATYVENGVTGVLTATWDLRLLGEATEQALTAAQAETDDRRAHRSRAVVDDRFTIQRMSAALSEVYARVDTEEHRALEYDGPASFAR